MMCCHLSSSIRLFLVFVLGLSVKTKKKKKKKTDPKSTFILSEMHHVG